MTRPYPAGRSERRRFITDSRPPIDRGHDPWQVHGTTIDEEPDERERPVRVGTVFLTGSECPWRCVMCDLWRYTIETRTPGGAIAAQVSTAMGMLEQQGGVRRVKLYNAGSFFDRRAVPASDLASVAKATRQCEQVTVESHPALVGAATETFLAQLIEARQAVHLPGRADPSPANGPHGPAAPLLEVAMGLETAHPEALDRLAKGVTLDGFRRAARRLAGMGAGLRVFLLVNPPFIPPARQDEWLRYSVDEAIACGAGVVSLIPTRGGNGAMESLAAAGAFTPPTLADLERSFALALGRPRSPRTRVLVDPWDFDRLGSCPACTPARLLRLRRMNLQQRIAAATTCAACGHTPSA